MAIRLPASFIAIKPLGSFAERMVLELFRVLCATLLNHDRAARSLFIEWAGGTSKSICLRQISTFGLTDSHHTHDVSIATGHPGLPPALRPLPLSIPRVVAVFSFAGFSGSRVSVAVGLVNQKNVVDMVIYSAPSNSVLFADYSTCICFRICVMFPLLVFYYLRVFCFCCFTYVCPATLACSTIFVQGTWANGSPLQP